MGFPGGPEAITKVLKGGRRREERGWHVCWAAVAGFKDSGEAKGQGT